QAAEILSDPGKGGSQFGSLTTGFAAGAERGFETAEHLPEVQQHTYEIRALRVPALYLMTLWLKDQQGQQDRFIVLPPAFPPLQPLVAYSAFDLLAILHRLAAATKVQPSPR